MDNEKCRLLIQLYGANDLLWNSKSSHYHNKSLRHDAWVQISKKMDIPIPDLKKKMTTLLASYRREKSRIAKSYRTGSATSEVYVSKWFAFDDFDFMKDKDLPNETLETIAENSPMTTNDNSTEPITPSATEQHVEVPNDTIKAPDNLRVKKKINAEEDSPMLKKAFEVLTESVASSSDPYFSYGQHIANELRKYDPRTLTYVKQAINNVIFEADLGKYSSYRHCTQYYTQSHYSSTPSPQPPTPSSQLPNTTPTAEREPTPPLHDFFP